MSVQALIDAGQTGSETYEINWDKLHPHGCNGE